MAPYFSKQFERHMLLCKGERNSPELFFLLMSVNMPFFDAFPRVSVTYALHHLAGLIYDSSINMTGSAKVTKMLRRQMPSVSLKGKYLKFAPFLYG